MFNPNDSESFTAPAVAAICDITGQQGDDITESEWVWVGYDVIRLRLAAIGTTTGGRKIRIAATAAAVQVEKCGNSS